MPARRNTPDVWPPFVVAAVGLAISAGFGLGGALFISTRLGLASGPWWPAAAQAHGHVQLFGWAGLMVLGVGLHFLPRLRGAPLAQPRLAPAICWLFVAALVVRALGQPLLAARALPVFAGWPLLVGAALLELGGGSLALGLLAWTLRRGPSIRDRAGLRAVLPFLLIAFSGFWLALAVNVAGALVTATRGLALVDGAYDTLTVELAFRLFLIPISVAMSARIFPLYFRTPLPRNGLLRAGLGALLAGEALDVAGSLGGWPAIAGGGDVLLAAALVAFIIGMGIFARRLPLPRQPVRVFTDPQQWHALTAYGWLAVAALLLAGNGLGALGLPGLITTPDAERHALGAGFVTVLIVGVGAHLLPGFTRRPLRSRALLWATAVVGNAAALCRVVPVVFTSALPGTLATTLAALSGLLGVATVAIFAVNVTGRSRSSPPAR
ncbi:MAG TPA: NnrS family protein [Thermomicrobiales bacterium]|nr:NnrS family protein [Thermomicrobiales bacterium]